MHNERTALSLPSPFKAYTGIFGGTWAGIPCGWAFAQPTDHAAAQASLTDAAIIFGFSQKAMSVIWHDDMPRVKAELLDMNIQFDENRLAALKLGASGFRGLRGMLGDKPTGAFQQGVIPSWSRLLTMTEKKELILVFAKSDFTHGSVSVEKDGFQLENGKSLCLVSMGRRASRFLTHVMAERIPGAVLQRKPPLIRLIRHSFHFGPPKKHTNDVGDRTNHHRFNNSRQMSATS